MSELGKKRAHKGYFITFEGGEGVGKSTQIKRLVSRLKSIGAPVTTSREPGGTIGAEAVRHVVLDKAAAQPLGPELEAMLFAAARLDHVEQIIKPALDRGDVVVIDRFMDSTRVYQGASNDLNPNFVASLERIAIANAVPDLTIILDLDPEIGLARVAKRRAPDAEVDRFEGETIRQHADRREAFLKIAKAEPDRCQIIDATGNADEVAATIWKVVSEAIKREFKATNQEETKRKPVPAAKL